MWYKWPKLLHTCTSTVPLVGRRAGGWEVGVPQPSVPSWLSHSTSPLISLLVQVRVDKSTEIVVQLASTISILLSIPTNYTTSTCSTVLFYTTIMYYRTVIAASTCLYSSSGFMISAVHVMWRAWFLNRSHALFSYYELYIVNPFAACHIGL